MKKNNGYQYIRLFSLLAILFAANTNVSAGNNKQYESDTAYINRLNLRSYELRSDNPDSSKYLAEQAIDLSEKIQYLQGLGDGYIRLGLYEKLKGDCDAAVAYYRKSLYYRKKIGDIQLIAKTYSNIGVAYNTCDKTDSAIYYHLQALRLAESIHDDEIQAKSYNNLGIAYQRNKDWKDAEYYYRKGIEQYKKLGSQPDVITLESNLGSLFIDMEQADSALSIFTKVLVDGADIMGDLERASVYNNMGLAYQLKLQPDQALNYYTKAADIYREYEAGTLAVILSNIGSIQVLEGNYTEGEKALLESNMISFENERYDLLSKNYKSLAIVQFSRNNSDSAITLLEKSYAFIDSIYSQEKADAIADFRTRYETEKKEQALLLSNEKNARQRIYMILLLVASFAAISILVLLFNRRQLRKRIEFQEKLSKERIRISSDLHDDIGSTLGSISYFSQLAHMQSGKQNETELRGLLDKIVAVSQEALENMSDIVWSINPANDSIEKMLLRMHNYARELLHSADIEYLVDVDQRVNDLRISMQQRKSVFLIFKETVYNAAKYAACTQVKVSVSNLEGKLKLHIQDNGKGFDTENYVSKNGNGIKNMRLRAEEAGAQFEIVSAPDKGTGITLIIQPAQ